MIPTLAFLAEHWHTIFAITLAFLIVPGAIALVDFTEVVHKFFHHRNIQSSEPVEQFVILVPIFGNMSYFKNADYLEQYRDKVILCTTAHESKEFYADLDAVCRRYGFRQHRSNLALRARGGFTRNPWKIFHTILEDGISPDAVTRNEAREALLIESSVGLYAPYCLFLDGDTRCQEDLRKVVGEFVANDYDLASVRIVPSKAETVMEHMQNIEYRIAMDARKLYPWLTSGACMVAKTDVLQRVLSHHSHFFQGGDIEIGKLTRLLGHHVGHIETEFRTDVPSTFKAWFKQRVAWSSGDFRHAIINIGSYSWRHPLFFFYFTVVVYAMMPMRLWLSVTDPIILPCIIAVYWLLLFTLHRQYRSKFLFVFPFYAMVQCLVVTPLGIGYYFYTVYRHRNVGIIRLRHQTMPKVAGMLDAQSE